MRTAYQGPLRQEPLAIELHNTLYATPRGEAIDGLQTMEGMGAWLEGIAERLPAQARGAKGSRRAEFLALRAAVREALHAALDEKRVPADALDSINRTAALAPASPLAVAGAKGRLRAERRFHTADPTDVALAAIAADAIELLSGARSSELRACGAPGCVLMFVKDHPRQRWCSPSCGNRARQARHYERERASRARR